jgi:hypothetical protein
MLIPSPLPTSCIPLSPSAGWLPVPPPPAPSRGLPPGPGLPAPPSSPHLASPQPRRLTISRVRVRVHVGRMRWYSVRVRRCGGRCSGLGLGGRDREPHGVRRWLRVCAVMWEPTDSARRCCAAVRRAPPAQGVGAAHCGGPQLRAVCVRVCR